MRSINLNPTGRTVYKVTQPGVEAARPAFTLEPMRFLFPFEAKKEAATEFSKNLLAHNNGRDWLMRKAG